MSLEVDFERDMLSVYERAIQAGYIPVIFKQMLDEHGGVETAKRLLAADEVQYGLDRLWELGMLGDSMEAVVIMPKYRSLFEEWEIAEARKRLEDRGFHG